MKFAQAVLLGLIVLAAPQLARWKIDSLNSSATVRLAAPNPLENGWNLSNTPLADWTPAFQNPSAHINVSYEKEAQKVGLYVAYYRQQDYQRKLVSSQNVLVVSKDPVWAQVSSGTSRLHFSGQPVAVKSAQLRGSALVETGAKSQLAVRHIYWINGKLIASDVQAKLYGALMRLFGRGDDSAVIALYANAQQNEQENALFESFLQSNGAVVLKMLDSISAQGRRPEKLP